MKHITPDTRLYNKPGTDTRIYLNNNRNKKLRYRRIEEENSLYAEIERTENTMNDTRLFEKIYT